MGNREKGLNGGKEPPRLIPPERPDPPAEAAPTQGPPRELTAMERLQIAAERTAFVQKQMAHEQFLVEAEQLAQALGDVLTNARTTRPMAIYVLTILKARIVAQEVEKVYGA